VVSTKTLLSTKFDGKVRGSPRFSARFASREIYRRSGFDGGNHDARAPTRNRLLLHYRPRGIRIDQQSHCVLVEQF
jgi:hypothetical protein